MTITKQEEGGKQRKGNGIGEASKRKESTIQEGAKHQNNIHHQVTNAKPHGEEEEDKKKKRRHQKGERQTKSSKMQFQGNNTIESKRTGTFEKSPQRMSAQNSSFKNHPPFGGSSFNSSSAATDSLPLPLFWHHHQHRSLLLV